MGILQLEMMPAIIKVHVLLESIRIISNGEVNELLRKTLYKLQRKSGPISLGMRFACPMLRPRRMMNY